MIGVSIWIAVMVAKGEAPTYALLGLFPIAVLAVAGLSAMFHWGEYDSPY